MRYIRWLMIFVSLILVLTPGATAFSQPPPAPNWTRALVWSPDGEQIAVGTQEGLIRILNADGEPLRTLQDSGPLVLTLDWSPDGRLLASGDWAGNVFIWDAAAGTVHTTLRAPDYVTSVDWSPGGLFLAAVSPDRGPATVIVWHFYTGEVVFKFRIPEALSAAWNPTNSRLAVGKSHAIQLWEPLTGDGKLITTLETRLPYILDLNWSPDGLFLVGAQGTGFEEVVNVWDMEAANLLLTYQEHTEIVSDVAWNPDGLHIASASKDNTVRVWNAQTGQTIRIYETDDEVGAIDWSPDGARLACGELNGVVTIRHPFDAAGP